MSETKKSRSKHRIPVIRILNPFDSRQQERTELIWSARKTLDQYFPVVESRQVVVSVSGRIVQPEQFSVTYLDKTDNIVVCPVPAGGGDGKSVLAMVAMIAVAVAAPMLAAAYGGTVASALGVSATMGSALVAAGVTMAGSLLVNAVIAPAAPSKTAAGDTKSSYGIDGAKNTSLEGIPVPVCYGKFRTAGNILGMYTTTDGDDNQTLYMLLSAGEGPVASISDIEINDNPLTDYHDVEVQTRLGLANQEVIPWFNDTVRAINKGQKLTTDWFYSTTTAPVDKLRLDFVAPTGMCEIDSKSAATKSHSVDLSVEYRKVGDATWSPLPLETDIQSWNYATRNGGQWYGDGGPLSDMADIAYLDSVGPIITDGSGGMTARYPTYSNGVTISGSKKSAVRRSYTTGKLTPANYEVRVCRVTPKSTKDNILDDVYLSDINEITLEDLSYPHTALVALKIKMTDQLSGLPSVTYLNGGKVVSVYDGTNWSVEASNNPAWVTWDILTNKRYGGAMPTARLELVAFKEFADYCDAQGLTWNGPIESETNVWDACQMVLRVGHSQIVPSGTRYTIVTEKPATPVMMFSVANMIEGSYKETWLGTQDRANELDVTFFDKNDKYKQRTIKVYDPDALTSGAPQRSSAITLYGVDNYERAYKEAQLQLNLNRHILKTVSFGAPLEAIACRVGDLIYVQTDLTDWAQAGRFDSGSTTSVMKLDRPVTMAAGKSYKLLAMRDAIQRATCTITNVIGNSIFLSGYIAGTSVKRIQVGGKDIGIDGTFDTGVIVQDSTGITAGQTCTLWDTDVIEEYNVVTSAGTSSSVTLQSPMSVAPAQFTQWMFGESEKVKKPFRVKAITGNSDYRRDITAIEYKSEVYDSTRYGSNLPVQVSPNTPIGPVSALSVYEETYVAGDNVATVVVASWAASTTGLYNGADVYVEKNGGAAEKVSDTKNRTSAVISASRGDALKVRVVAFDVFGKRSKYEEAPTATYTVIGEAPNLEVGFPTGAGFVWSGRDCKINWRYNATTHSYEFGSEPTGADAGALDPHFKDYEIRVYNADKTLRRTEYTTDNSYVYIYDKNFADGVTRDLIFEIRQRDTFNNLGEPAVLEAHNPPPYITSTSAVPSFDSVTIRSEHSDDPDFSGVMVWVSGVRADLEDITSDLAAARLVYAGPDSACVVPDLMFNLDYYYRVAGYDAFGKTGLVPSSIQSFKTSYFNVDTIKDQMIPVAKFASEIDPVGIVDALPDPTTWVRPTVLLLKTDGKLYRLVNKAWTAAVPAADINGQLVAAQIADNAINTAKFAQGLEPVSIVASLPAVAGYTGPKVVMLSTDGKLYRLSAGAWTAAIPAADVTGKLTDAQIDALAAAKLTGTITSTQITDNAITTAKINAGAITTAKIAANAITANEIAANAITATKIDAGAVTTAKLAAGAVTANEIAANTITSAKIQAGAITATEIAANAISTSKLAAGAVTANEIAANAVTAGKIAAGAVSATNIAANTITADQIAANSLTAGVIAAGAIGADQIAANAITAGKLATTQLLTTSAQIGDGLIVTAKIGDAQVNTLKIGANAVTVPVSAHSNNQVYGTGTNQWKQLIRGYIKLDDSGIVYAHAICSQRYGQGVRYWSMRISINGVIGSNVGGQSVVDTPVIAMSRALPAGTYPVVIEWWGENNGVHIENVELFIIGAKR